MLYIETLEKQIVVRDSDGGVWWPNDDAAAEIFAADDPGARAIELCESSPMRGEWKD